MKKYNYKDILKYLVGNYRRLFFYIPFRNLLFSQHIRKQIVHRIKMMKPEHYNNDTCIKCGCKTTALQMRNKACKGQCYPEMFNREEWNLLKDDRWANTYTYGEKGDTTGKTLVWGFKDNTITKI